MCSLNFLSLFESIVGCFASCWKIFIIVCLGVLYDYPTRKLVILKCNINDSSFVISQVNQSINHVGQHQLTLCTCFDKLKRKLVILKCNINNSSFVISQVNQSFDHVGQYQLNLFMNCTRILSPARIRFLTENIVFINV
jgi:hypothetical protein